MGKHTDDFALARVDVDAGDVERETGAFTRDELVAPVQANVMHACVVAHRHLTVQ